jgi:hypothetical protein
MVKLAGAGACPAEAAGTGVCDAVPPKPVDAAGAATDGTPAEAGAARGGTPTESNSTGISQRDRPK